MNFIFSAFVFILGLVTSAQAATVTCYDIQSPADMQREEHPVPRAETWCYEQNSVRGETFIYNADSDTVKPELALLIDNKGYLVHGSLQAGKVTLHKVKASELNPYSIPLLQPVNLPVAQIDTEKSQLLSASAQATAATFRMVRKNENLNSLAAAAVLPWRGYWWPRKGAPMVIPLVKYDTFVSAREANPAAATWERSRHAYNGVNWAGHCNGWTASAILRSEPVINRTDATSGVTFSVSDQKGLLAELDYCVSTAFFGNRNNGGGNNGDIRPELFHKTVLYYIGSLRKPVVMDYRSDASVDNHIASAYTMQVQQISATQKIVTANMTFHGYDRTASNAIGIAPRYTRIYKYNLTTNAAGQIIGGSWISGNPDFIWVPLSPARCRSNNQQLASQWVTTILSM